MQESRKSLKPPTDVFTCRPSIAFRYKSYLLIPEPMERETMKMVLKRSRFLDLFERNNHGLTSLFLLTTYNSLSGNENNTHRLLVFFH